MSLQHLIKVDIASLMPTWPPDLQHTYEIHFDGWWAIVSCQDYEAYCVEFDGPLVEPDQRYVRPEDLFDFIGNHLDEITAFGFHGNVRDRSGQPFAGQFFNAEEGEEEEEMPYFNLTNIPNGKENAIGENTEFINQNFMGLRKQPARKADYVYLVNEVGKNGKAHRAWHRNAIQQLKVNARHPVTGKPMRINNFRKVV